MGENMKQRESSRIYAAFQEWTLKKKQFESSSSLSRKKVLLNEHGNVNGKEKDDFWFDLQEDNNQVYIDTLEKLTVTTETIKDIRSQLEQGLETGDAQREVKNQSTQTEDLEEEAMQRRELEFRILQSQVISLNTMNNGLLKKMKEYEDKEKESNEMAKKAMERVVSLEARNKELENDSEEEMKMLTMIRKEMEAVMEQLQQP